VRRPGAVYGLAPTRRLALPGEPGFTPDSAGVKPQETPIRHPATTPPRAVESLGLSQFPGPLVNESSGRDRGRRRRRQTLL